ncbi:Y-family DNA polymerase [Adhaeribacter radiodurans]|uniref:Y-family DNA polymerase n=1 Tax=Adhaeribacter radiodurans TaxID=2745197 RepID=A0A7L7L183_9BACT|nr:Y-family DNA polymerase [Adhaeribacter radiodurans]QMU26552.1 Y-family DNA polymerase [Adhaeribacter radiodurans]
MTSLFLHADINNCYASIFRIFNPELTGKPIIVLSNNDGSIIARSQEAKDLGIKMGQPFFEAKAIIDKHQIQVYSSNYPLFHDLSTRFHNTLGTFSPNQEIYSIDEGFLDLGNFYNTNLQQYGRTIKQTVWKWLGLPICVGIAPTKTLAKLANRIAKKSAKANGVLVLNTPDHITSALKIIDVGDVWGIGRQYAIKLRNFGIYTAWDLSKVTDAFAKKHLTIVGLRIVKELRGEACADLEIEPPAKKGICTSRSFGQPVTTLNLLEEAVATYMTRSAYKLRKQKSRCSQLSVFLETNPFKENEAQYNNCKTIQLPVPTNSTLELINYALIALRAIYREGYKYKKAGVLLDDISPATAVQGNIFDTIDRGKHLDLMQTLDLLTRKLGTGIVKVAKEGIEKSWKMRQDYGTPCYTTRMEDILVVR